MDATLVLGGTGFLGAHLVAASYARARASAAARGERPVVGVGRAPERAPRFGVPRDGPQWEALDLCQATPLQGLLERLSPSCVLSCAALSRVSDCERDPALAQTMNVEHPAQVARWCAAAGARLVHVSTDLVFGGEPVPRGGFDEDSAAAPVSVYGASKRAGEQAVEEAYPGALVVRLPLLYGNSGGRGLGASDSLLEGLERGERPALFVDEWRTPLEVSNAAEALVELAQGASAGLLHVGGPERIDRHALGLAVLEGMGLPEQGRSDLVRAARQADVATTGERPADVSLNSARARSLLTTELLGVGEGIARSLC